MVSVSARSRLGLAKDLVESPALHGC